MLNDLLRGHHAGVSKWGNNIDLNSSSVGIEIDNNGSEPFTEPQIASLLTLLDRLKKRIPSLLPILSGMQISLPAVKWIPAVIFPGSNYRSKDSVTGMIQQP